VKTGFFIVLMTEGFNNNDRDRGCFNEMPSFLAIFMASNKL